MKKHLARLQSGGFTLCGRYASLVTILPDDKFEGEAPDVCKSCCRAWDAEYAD